MSYQFIKKVNESEINKRGTNESYIAIPKEVDISDIFLQKNHIYNFKKKSTGKIYKIRYTITTTGQKRIVGLGHFYREDVTRAGSRVILERRHYADNKNEYYIDSVSNDLSLVLQVSRSKGIRILNDNNNLELLLGNESIVWYKGEFVPICLEFHKNVKPRKDSKEGEDYYNLLIAGKNVNSSYSHDNIIEIIFKEDICQILESIPYQKIVIGSV